MGKAYLRYGCIKVVWGGGGGTMLFHAFSDVYTVKELDYHAKHGQHFTIWMYNSISVLNISLPGSYKFRRVVFDCSSCRHKRWWNSLYGHISRKNAPVHASTRERAKAAHQHASFGCTVRDSLGKNVSKEVCFWLWGKDNLVKLPEEPSVT